MNKVIEIGRLTADPDVRTGANDTQIAKYTLAVPRRGKKDEADFINCVCFGKSAEFAEKYLHKGTKIAITGRIQTGSYENKEGKKVYTTDVIVEEHEFVESKKDVEKKEELPPKADNDGFMNIPDGIAEELPFN